MGVRLASEEKGGGQTQLSYDKCCRWSFCLQLDAHCHYKQTPRVAIMALLACRD
jgi:hypothetical protein